jgi:rRNA maturation RNase YbeY
MSNQSPHGVGLHVDIRLEDSRWFDMTGATIESEIEVIVQSVAQTAFTTGNLAASVRLPSCATELCIVLASDTLSRELNKTWRGIDSPTNVLSFALGNDDKIILGVQSPFLLGDIVLAYETVSREAASLRKAPVDHLRHLVVHGVLHLLGYDHQTDFEAEIMEQLEVEILANFSIPNPYKAVLP